MRSVGHGKKGQKGGLQGLTLINAGKKACPRGHPYDLENTYITPNGWRRCKTCAREKRRLVRGWDSRDRKYA